MARGFLNLNRFRHSKAVKRDSKQKAHLQRDKKAGGKRP